MVHNPFRSGDTDSHRQTGSKAEVFFVRYLECLDALFKTFGRHAGIGEYRTIVFHQRNLELSRAALNFSKDKAGTKVLMELCRRLLPYKFNITRLVKN